MRYTCTPARVPARRAIPRSRPAFRPLTVDSVVRASALIPAVTTRQLRGPVHVGRARIYVCQHF